MASEFSIKRRVEFVETDMAGIMHFSNFFRWMESCESAFYRSLDLKLISFVPGQVVGWPRVTVSCSYRAPLYFNDSVEVTLFVKKIGTRSITYVFNFHKGEELIAVGEMTAVCVTSDGQGGMKVQAIPDDVRCELDQASEGAWEE